MATFTANVSLNGVHLFRTEEADNGIADVNLEKVKKILVDRFPPADGYEVMIIEWPGRTGHLVFISKP